nr:MAG TPA: hypothetical protein [Caudoviricetes sp.]
MVVSSWGFELFYAKHHAYRICCPNGCGGWVIPTCSTLDKHGFWVWRLSSPGFMKCHKQTPCLERVLY